MMKRKDIVNILLMMLLTITQFSCSGKKNNNIKKVNFDHFKVSVIQDGINKEINENEVKILRKPFSIEILLPKPDGIFLSASFSHDSFIPALENKPVNEIPGFTGTIIAEELFNKDELLTISKNLPNFWNYKNENDHRFNSITKKNGIYYCNRKISYLINIDSNKEKVNIENTKNGSIYLVFMKIEWNQDYSIKIEKKRYLIKLVFIDEIK